MTAPRPVTSDPVARIEIGADGRLHVVPSAVSFPYAWREATEVHWDAGRRSLYAPPPQVWSRARWLRQILDTARAQGVDLVVTEETAWAGVEPDDEAEMRREAGPRGLTPSFHLALADGRREWGEGPGPFRFAVENLPWRRLR